MAQSYVTDAGTLIIPSASVQYKVETANSGLGTTGVLMLVGEADSGPDWSLETTLSENSFGADQLAAVVSKYGSGPLVDAFRAATAPANDPNITGSFFRAVLVKTNVSVKAKANLTKVGGGTYGVLADKTYGKLGNRISYLVSAATSETLPTTGSFTWIPNVASMNTSFRVNGGAALALTVAANRTPTALVSDVDALSGVAATGGAARTTIQASVGTLALAVVSGNSVTITYSGTFTTTPSVGDTVVIPTASVIDGGGSDNNVGAYVVTAATSSTISATKLSDGGKSGATAGVITAPIAVSAASVGGTPASEMVVYAPVTITLEAGSVIDGLGKTLEINELTSGTDLLSRSTYQLGTTTAATWVSKAAATAQVLTAATEYRVKLSNARTSTSNSEDLEAGGEVALKLGYVGTTASLTIDDSTATFTVVGGSGATFSVDLKDFPTIAELAEYVNAQTGFKCAVGTAILGQLPSTALDNVTAATFGTTFGEYTLRLKIDAYRFFNKIQGESALVQLLDTSDDEVQAAAGIPATTSALAFLAGGSKGGTTAAGFVAAVDALEKVDGNFLIPLFSRDATSDITDKLTESTSTYTVDAITAYCRTHVLKMSTLKKRRFRQAIVSKKGTFSAVRESAANMASGFCYMTFQDVRNVASDGTIKQYQPWMGAVIAGAMQAAGFYRGIVRKFANISGALQAAADFNDQDDTAVENALLSGLLPLRKAQSGGWYWVSDQSTYGKDSNFVYNSLQAVYVANVIAMTTAQRMEQAFVGQSVADISAPLAKAFLETIMEDFLRLKLIAASDDAAKGFKNALVRIRGTAMEVSFEIKLAGLLYFVPINFAISAVEQTA